MYCTCGRRNVFKHILFRKFRSFFSIIEGFCAIISLDIYQHETTTTNSCWMHINNSNTKRTRDSCVYCTSTVLQYIATYLRTLPSISCDGTVIVFLITRSGARGRVGGFGSLGWRTSSGTCLYTCFLARISRSLSLTCESKSKANSNDNYTRKY